MSNTDNQRYVLDHASIEWQQENPYSLQHKDIYWSRGNPVQEKRHVFANQHQLQERGKGASQFTILETGFGFGNNFLITANLWRELGHQGMLNYIAIENSPVNPADLKRHFKFVKLKYADWLLEHYPFPFRTNFVFWLEDNIRLILIFDDVIPALDNLSARVDAWYLDGFSPSSNTDLWNRKLYGRLFSLSKPGATLSSYTVAGHVRQGLNNAGFDTRKSKGFGNKAEMLTGNRPGIWQADTRMRTSVAVIGSGIAGTTCVEALNRRHLEVQLISNDHPNAASNIPHLAIYPQLGLRCETRYQLSLSAFEYVQHENPRFKHKGLDWHSKSPSQRARMSRIADQFPDEYMSSEADSVHFPSAGWLSHETPDGSIHFKGDVKEVKSIDGQWEIYTSEGRLITRVDHVIIAMGIQSPLLIDVPLIPLRGQALSVRLNKPIPQPLTGDLTVIQGDDGICTVGSTFQRNDTDLKTRDTDSRRLLDSLVSLLPDVSPEIIDTHVGIRATTRDRLPLVGRVPDWRALTRYIERNEAGKFVGYQPGLYLSTGFGSHGATYSRLCGEYIANLICNEPLALTCSQQQILAIERFQLRDARTRRSRHRTR